MPESVKSIGFLLWKGPDHEDPFTVASLSESALKRGLAVHIFLNYEGVLNSANPRFEELADRGAKVTVCAHYADQLKAHRSEKFKYGSQYDHANMIGQVDRYLAFI